MKYKLIIAWMLCLTAYYGCFGQQKFIEVLVKDTVRLQPLSYEFEVSSSNEFRYDHLNPDGEKDFTVKLRESEEKIIRLLKKWNYKFSPNQNPDANYPVSPTTKRGFIVKINGDNEKELFKSKMRESDVNFHAVSATFEDKESKEEKIYTKLIKKAKKKAELLARLSDLEVGEIMEISESKSEIGLVSSFIENFAYSRSSGATSTSFSFNTGVLEKSLLVKYKAK